MPRYKYTGPMPLTFRAGPANGKSRYHVNPGESIEVPVEVTHGQLVLDDGEMTISKKRKGSE